MLKAEVRRVTGKTKHFLGTLVEGVPRPLGPLPPPDWVGISEVHEGYLLLHFNAAGSCITDTWHESLEAAKSQAQFEFEIASSDWQVTEEQIDF
jgi:hypothetical protein